MSVQTAELNLIGFDSFEELQLSCSLRNIARGNCNLKIKNLPIGTRKSWGTLHISIDRPIMIGEIYLRVERLKELTELFKFSYPRPVTLIVLLSEKLFINTPGDLRLDSEKTLRITDISWNMPLA